MKPLPQGSEGFADATWAEVLPYYDALAAAPLDGEALTDWLRAWSRLEALLSEAASLAMIAYTCDTGDPAKEAAHLRFSTEIIPRAEEQGVRLARRLVADGRTPDGLETTLARFRASIEIFREANVPLFSELEELAARYQRLTGSMLADWEGDRVPLPRLAPFLQSRDRGIRERAFRAGTAPYAASREELAALFDTMYERRQTVARQADFRDFQASPSPPSTVSTTRPGIAPASTMPLRRSWCRPTPGCCRTGASGSGSTASAPGTSA